TNQKRVDALQVVGSVARAPQADLEAKLDQTIRSIMEKPITAVEGIFSPTRMLNAAAGQMCQQFNVITRKVPFDAKAEPALTMEERSTLLRPPSGKIWEFHQQNMAQFVTKQGSGWELTAEGAKTLNPTFARFYRDVLRFADAIYPAGQGPQLHY